jgi:decaprenylphospho-beta-D-erythro-pentofuranosid-2-ulose 2-reductase
MPVLFQRAIVIGASSGIGREIARQLAASGCRVACVSRSISNESLGENLTAYSHDVTHFSEIPALFQKICQDLGGLDVIFYSSGVMPRVALSEYNFEKDRQMIEVNLLGAVAWLNEAAQRFEQTKAGTIVGISSVAGDRGRAQSPVYGTTKAAFDCYLESLRNRVGTSHVAIVVIKPGPVDTPMTKEIEKKPLLISAEEAARQTIAAAIAKKRIAYVPGVWRLIMGVIKIIPSPIFQKLKL